jgi:aryl-alcohol dehydrogenase-like predicted oxidoreductase
MELPKCTLGKTGIEVARLGLGGEGILRTFGEEKAAEGLIRRALDLGLTYFESARAYSGSESYYGKALKGRREDVFLATKSHARSAAGARRHLAESLAALSTDRIDLWQVHDLRTEEDLSELFGPKGAMETFERARREGAVRFIGVTGHENPEILLKAIETAEFDAVLLPVNPAEPAYRPFMDTVIPKAVKRGMWVVGMKVLARGILPKLSSSGSPDLFLQYALSVKGVSLVVVGCDDVHQLKGNVEAVSALSGAPPMTAKERAELEEALSPVARRILYYQP